MEDNQIQIPEGWSKEALGKKIRYEQPYRFIVKSTNYDAKSGTPVLTAGKSFILGYTREVDNIYEEIPVIIFDDFTTDTKYVEFHFKVKSSAIKFLKAKNENDVELKFVFEKLQTLRITETGGDHKRRWISEFSKIEVLFPSFQEQQKIADILSKTDKAIAETEALIAKYNRIKTGLMQDLLTKGIDEKGVIRSEVTHEFKDSALGRIPKEWEVEKLGDLIIAVDPQPDHRTPPIFIDGVPYIGISDFIGNGEIDTKNCRRVGFNVLKKQSQAFTIEKGDIIFGKIGTIGKPKVLPDFKKQPFTLSANIILIKPLECPSFIYWTLISDYITNQVSLAIHSTSQPAFGMEKIRNLDIITPKPKERDRITEKLIKLEDLFSKEEIKLNKLQSIKTGLMQDLLSGKVRVQRDSY